MKPTTLHAWFSLTMARISGTYIYQNAKGETIEATTLTKTKECPCTWDDTAYLGEVVKFISRGSEGELDKETDDMDMDVRKIFELFDREEARMKDPNRWN